jgi:hypothetical protein
LSVALSYRSHASGSVSISAGFGFLGGFAMIDHNEERLAFYHRVGLAITHWAHIEFGLASIVATCFERKEAQRVMNGFLSIENIRAKLQYVNTTLSSQNLSVSQKAKWAELAQRVETLARKRNRLAHSWVFNDPNEKAGRRTMLLPTRPTTKQSRQKHPGAICLRDVAGYALEFAALMVALENFSNSLVGQKARFPKSLEQPQHPPTLAKLRREIYAFAQRPPKSSKR